MAKKKTIDELLKEGMDNAHSIDYHQHLVQKVVDELKGKRLTEDQKLDLEELETYTY